MQENTQEPEGVIVPSIWHTVEVHSVFKTVQGEGPYAGQPAIFIRLAGCNLRCPGCDTEYTKDRTVMTPAKVVERVNKIKGKDAEFIPLVVITGGEPFRQPLRTMIEALFTAGYRVQLETNGTLPSNLPYHNLYYIGTTPRLTIVCSPKTGKISPLLKPHIHAYKYVLQAGSVSCTDGLPIAALQHPCPEKGVARPPKDFPKGKIFVQPMDEGSDSCANKANLEAALESAQKFGYTFCLQVHKFINLP